MLINPHCPAAHHPTAGFCGFFRLCLKGGSCSDYGPKCRPFLALEASVNVSWSAVPPNQLNHTQSRPFHPNTSNHAWKPHFCARNVLICVFQLHCYSNKLEKLKRCVDICLICALHWCNIYVYGGTDCPQICCTFWPCFPVKKVNNQSSAPPKSCAFWLRSC